jgi:hypothetical protein
MATSKDTLNSAGDDNKVLAIVTIDVAEAFYYEMTGLLKRIKEIAAKEPDFVNSYKMGIQFFKRDLYRKTEVLLLRLKAGRDAPPIHPFVGRMHFEYSQVRPKVL